MSSLALTLNSIADFLILIAFVAALVFAISYVSFFRWQKTKAGRAILYVFVSWIGVTLISLLARFIGQDYWMREWFRLIGWGLVVFAVINLIRVLWYNFVKGSAPLSLESRHDTASTPVIDSGQEGE